MQRKHLLLALVAALLVTGALGRASSRSRARHSGGGGDGGDDDDKGGHGSKDKTAYSKPFLNKGADIVGCKHAEVGDDDDAEPVCSECKGPNFVFNDATNGCDCAEGYGTYATQHGTGKPCERCPRGWYGAGGDPEDAECYKCPSCTSTSNKKGGASSVDDCNVYAPGYGWSGEGDDDDSSGNCAICEVGSWSDGGLRKGNGCYECPRSHSGLKTTTADEGAVTPTACKIEVCKPGYAINKLGRCKECPDGYTSDGGSVEDGADQPLCRELEDGEEPPALIEEKKAGGHAAGHSKDGGKGVKYAPEEGDAGVDVEEQEAKAAEGKKTSKAAPRTANPTTVAAAAAPAKGAPAAGAANAAAAAPAAGAANAPAPAGSD